MTTKPVRTIERWAQRLTWEFEDVVPNIAFGVDEVVDLLSQELEELMNSEKLQAKEGQWCKRASHVIRQHNPGAPKGEVTMLAAVAATMLMVYLSSRTEVDADMIRNINESLEIRVGKEAADDMASRVSKAFRLAGCEQVKVEIAEAISASGETGHVDLTLRSHVGGTPVAVAVEAELPAESILQGEAGLQREVVLKSAACRIEQVAELNTPEGRAILDFLVSKGLLDCNYQPLGMTRVQQAYLADVVGNRLLIQKRWKCFADLWGISNPGYFRSCYNKGIRQANMGDFIDVVKNIFIDCPV